MKNIVLILGVLLISSGAFSEASMPQCKDARGNVVLGTIDQLKQIMKSTTNRPQAFATGTVTSILPDDTQGLPHQKFFISVDEQINLEIVSNLDFGRVPLRVGQTISVCGEYLNVGQGMIHWTHFDPHGGHAEGFTILNGQLFGQEQTATTGELRE